MTRKAPHQLLAALRESLSARTKSAAHETWPGAADAEARMSRVLSGELGIPARLLELALVGPGGEKLLNYLKARAAADPRELRREALETLQRVEQQLSLAFERLDQANQAEADQAAQELRRPALKKVPLGAKRHGRVA